MAMPKSTEMPLPPCSTRACAPAPLSTAIAAASSTRRRSSEFMGSSGATVRRRPVARSVMAVMRMRARSMPLVALCTNDANALRNTAPTLAVTCVAFRPLMVCTTFTTTGGAGEALGDTPGGSVGLGVLAGVRVELRERVMVAVAVAVCDGVPVPVAVSVRVPVPVAAADRVTDMLRVTLAVSVGVRVSVCVGVCVRVAVSELVGVTDSMGLELGLGLALALRLGDGVDDVEGVGEMEISVRPRRPSPGAPPASSAAARIRSRTTSASSCGGWGGWVVWAVWGCLRRGTRANSMAAAMTRGAASQAVVPASRLGSPAHPSL